MTENLLQKLEEKMMLLLSELEDARKTIEHSRKEIDNYRKEIANLSNENASLISEKENHANKLQDLVSLLDAIDLNEPEPVIANTTIQAVKPVLVQGSN
ncbi:MAG: hypothetical protein JO149_07095 [Gammaproteobacteria bacterium]|nr:hypothetical protein [Gammaproteobacteria bacterium]